MTYTLKSYSAERGLSTDFTEETLILSHKRVIEENTLLKKEKYENYNNAREAGRNAGYFQITSSEYVKVELIKNMTVEQLSEFING